MSNSEKAGKISADQKAEAESMQSLKTVALQRIAREIRQIYSDPRDINLYSEQNEWNVDEILLQFTRQPIALIFVQNRDFKISV